MNHALQDPILKRYLYVTRDDLIDCFGDDVVLTLKNYEKYETPAYQEDDLLIYDRILKVSSRNSPIDVRLVTSDGNSVLPVNEVRNLMKRNVDFKDQSLNNSSLLDVEPKVERTRKRKTNPQYLENDNLEDIQTASILLRGIKFRSSNRVRKGDLDALDTYQGTVFYNE